MRHLLIDGDVVAYKAAIAVEKAIEWEPGMWTWHADEDEAKAAILSEVAYLLDTFGADKFTLALTDSVNFRKAILPTYKGNRANVKKPLVLSSIRKWLVETQGAKMKPGLEGDDILGIMATMKHTDERIIISIDKDLKSIPGLYVRKVEDGVTEVSEVEADIWHLMQTLMGDATDGYKGCPGIGAKKAEKLLQDAGSSPAARWKVVVETYTKANLDEHEALTQARVARILRASDYDFKTNKPILWSPPQ